MEHGGDRDSLDHVVMRIGVSDLSATWIPKSIGKHVVRLTFTSPTTGQPVVSLTTEWRLHEFVMSETILSLTSGLDISGKIWNRAVNIVIARTASGYRLSGTIGSDPLLLTSVRSTTSRLDQFVVSANAPLDVVAVLAGCPDLMQATYGI